MKKQPGVMLYFDRLRFLDELDSARCGVLFRAILNYAENGAEPDFEDPELRIAWKAIGPAIDQDAARYQEVCEKRRQAIEKRWDAERNKRDTFVYN